MDVKYYIDGVDLLQYGVHISDSDGLLSKPKMKAPTSMNWPTYHGEMVDLSKKYYEQRTIKLDCFVKATDPTDFITKCNVFQALFDKAWTRRLSVMVEGNEPLVYEVYAEDAIDVKKKWNKSKMIGTFSLTLKEPEPIKKVYKYTRTSLSDKTVSLQFTSTKMINVYWGDGSHTFDASGTEQQLEHNYATNGVFYIVITGDIDAITGLQTNAKLVWNKL